MSFPLPAKYFLKQALSWLSAVSVISCVSISSYKKERLSKNSRTVAATDTTSLSFAEVTAGWNCIYNVKMTYYSNHAFTGDFCINIRSRHGLMGRGDENMQSAMRMKDLNGKTLFFGPNGEDYIIKPVYKSDCKRPRSVDCTYFSTNRISLERRDQKEGNWRIVVVPTVIPDTYSQYDKINTGSPWMNPSVIMLDRKHSELFISNSLEGRKAFNLIFGGFLKADIAKTLIGSATDKLKTNLYLVFAL